jgi:hypothetical protein
MIKCEQCGMYVRDGEQAICFNKFSPKDNCMYFIEIRYEDGEPEPLTPLQQSLLSERMLKQRVFKGLA